MYNFYIFISIKVVLHNINDLYQIILDTHYKYLIKVVKATDDNLSYQIVLNCLLLRLFMHTVFLIKYAILNLIQYKITYSYNLIIALITFDT